MTTAIANSLLTLPAATSLAQKIGVVLSPACERIQIAGSVRRKKAAGIKDLDFLCIPKPWEFRLGTQAYASALHELLDGLVSNGRLLPGPRDGVKWKTYLLPARPDTKIEIRITTPEKWPIELAIHTGPAAFSKALVTPIDDDGLLPAGYRWSELDKWTIVDSRGAAVRFKDEEEYIRWCCGRWIEPEERE